MRRNSSLPLSLSPSALSLLSLYLSLCIFLSPRSLSLTLTLTLSLTLTQCGATRPDRVPSAAPRCWSHLCYLTPWVYAYTPKIPISQAYVCLR